MLKKFVLVVVILLVATNVWAVRGPADVAQGPHNLGTSSMLPQGGGPASNEDEVCIFCHTPHGGTLDGPLWNRNLPDQTAGKEFTHYTSATLSGYFTPAMKTRAVNKESLLCMSCHDGVIAMNSIINSSNRTGAFPDNSNKMQPMFFGNPVIGDPDATAETPSIPLGRNLSDDHPISFSYEDNVNYGSNNLKLQLVGYADDWVRFFDAPVAGMGPKRVECSTCHDPHVDYISATGNTDYSPFLITPNTASALCLACHIK